MSHDLTTLFDELRRFRSVWVSRGWSWDRRFECAASTFDISVADEAARLVNEAFAHRWNHKTLAQAPPLVQAVAERTGGVRQDQLLLSSADAPVIAYGLWWPWGGEGTNISLRVGIAGAIDGGDQMKLQQVFGALS